MEYPDVLLESGTYGFEWEVRLISLLYSQADLGNDLLVDSEADLLNEA